MRPSENAEARIIRLLRMKPDGHVSGERISRTLGMSRAAVWKHIDALRKAGYEIKAVPSKGYMLGETVHEALSRFNAAEISAGLTAKTIGRKIFFYPELTSTNQKAMELGRLGEIEGAVVVAERQSAGKGRLGRRWESPSGVNLYTSIILRPRIPTSEAQKLTLMLAAAVAQTIAEFSPVRPEVKWPNDILINSKKAAGILTEMDAEPDRVNFIVAGIGVNVNMTAADTPPFLRPIATSIRQVRGGEISRAVFTQRLYSNVEKWYDVFLEDGFEPVVAGWKKFFSSEGKAVKVTAFNRTIKGLCMGIDKGGALLVRTPSGAVERIISGDVETEGI